MNTFNIIRSIKLSAPTARTTPIKSRLSVALDALTRRLFPIQVVGNPLHEAWSADGEPLERITPEQVAKSSATQHVVVPHSRGR